MFHFDILSLVHSIGSAGVVLAIFLESGIPFFFFFPGDSLLFTAGLLASLGYLSLPFLVLALPVAAILGDSLGYWLGAKSGEMLVARAEEGRSRFIRPSHIKRTQVFFDTYGAYAVILSRFVPVVRTLVPLLAGAGSMRYGRFLFYNILGGLLWCLGILFLGYFLGRAVPQAQHYLLPISIGIIFLSLLPAAFGAVRAQSTRVPQE